MDLKLIVDIFTIIMGISSVVASITSIYFGKKSRDDSQKQFKKSVEQAQINNKLENEKFNILQKNMLFDRRIENAENILSYVVSVYSSVLAFNDDKKVYERLGFDSESKLSCIYYFFCGIQGIKEYLNICNEFGDLDYKERISIMQDEKHFNKFLDYDKYIKEEMHKFDILFIQFDNTQEKILLKLVLIYEKISNLIFMYGDYIYNYCDYEYLLDDIIDGINELYDKFIKDMDLAIIKDSIDKIIL